MVKVPASNLCNSGQNDSKFQPRAARKGIDDVIYSTNHVYIIGKYMSYVSTCDYPTISSSEVVRYKYW